jgi:hypothetical protein
MTSQEMTPNTSLGWGCLAQVWVSFQKDPLVCNGKRNSGMQATTQPMLTNEPDGLLLGGPTSASMVSGVRSACTGRKFQNCFLVASEDWWQAPELLGR